MATKKATAKKEETIVLRPIDVKTCTVRIEGMTPLILHRMDAYNKQILLRKQKGMQPPKKIVGEDYKWMSAITSLTWKDANPKEWTEAEYDKALEDNAWTKEAYYELIENDAPCISSFGLRKSIGQAVTRLGFETYSTNFNASFQILEKNIPIAHAASELQEKLIPTPTGSPVLSYTTQFNGWSAEFTFRYIENYYSLEQILNFINYAGFAIGIGSGRPGKSASDYGTYKIVSIK